jgi:hypothetical protein
MATRGAFRADEERAWGLLRREGTILSLALGIALALQVELVLSKSINWDELFHFSQIHQHLRGEHVQWLQTPHVHLYAWVAQLPGDALTHIRLIRLMMVGFELFVVAVIIDFARRQSSPETGKLVGLLWLTGGFIFSHGFALRADIIATALLMGALWIAFVRPWRIGEFAAIGALTTLAAVATIKSALYLPAFLGVALLRRDDWPVVGRLAIMASAAAVAVMLLVAASAIDLRVATRELMWIVPGSIERMFTAGMFPQGTYLLKQVLIAPILAFAIGFSGLYYWRKGKRDAKHYTWLLLLAPLLSLAVYRNAYPYHYVFLLAPAMLALAPSGEWLRSRLGGGGVAALLIGLALLLNLAEDRTVTARQEVFQQGIHQIFPQPVYYFDDVGIVPDYPRAVPRFASGWGLAGYRAHGRPDYSLAAAAAPVPLFIKQGYALDHLTPSPDDELALLPVDARMLRENYIRHWGIVFVSGKYLPKGVSPQNFTIIAPGIYTVERAALTIDGIRYGVGEIVDLDRGEHRVGPRARDATLRWGRHLPVPDVEWPTGPIFTDY